MGINIYTWTTKYELDQMTRYLELIQSSLGQRLDEIEDAYEKDLARDMTENAASRLEDHYTDDFLEVGRDFPQYLLSSFIMAWYSFVEQNLLDLCEKLKLSISVKPTDNKNLGKGIRRARRFLLEANEYEIYPSHWQELVEIGKLRNFIVHRGTKITGSYFPSDDKDMALKDNNDNTIYFQIGTGLYQHVKKQDIVEQDSFFLSIVPSFDYCMYLIDFSRELFSKLHKDLLS